MLRRTLLKTAAIGVATIGLSACSMSMSSDEPGNIVEVAQSAGSFDTLVTAVTAADLGDTLATGGPFTVFAPTDDAFAALPAGTLDTLLMPENKDQLTQILTYHVVPGRITSDMLAGKLVDVKTVEGSTLRIDGRDGVTVDGATVVTPDIPASNGVIHVIDAVLLP